MAVICTYLTSRAEKEGTNKAHQAIDLFNAMNRELLRKYAAQPEYQDYKLSVWYDGGKDMKKFADAFKDNALTEDIEEELQGIVASVFLKPKDGIIEIDLISKSALEN